jgi:hypothetical protein
VCCLWSVEPAGAESRIRGSRIECSDTYLCASRPYSRRSWFSLDAFPGGTLPGALDIRIVTFEACSGFTHVTARRIAQPPKAAFVTRLQPYRLPGRTARQLPDQSTTLWVESSSTSDPRLRGALPTAEMFEMQGWLTTRQSGHLQCRAELSREFWSHQFSTFSTVSANNRHALIILHVVEHRAYSA